MFLIFKNMGKVSDVVSHVYNVSSWVEEVRGSLYNEACLGYTVSSRLSALATELGPVFKQTNTNKKPHNTQLYPIPMNLLPLKKQ